MNIWQTKRIALTVSFIVILSLAACTPKLGLVSPKDDILLFVDHVNNSIMVVGAKRYYVVEGEENFVTSKGVQTITPGMCFDWSTITRYYFPIKEIIPFSKELDTPGIRKEIEKQADILKKEGYKG